MFGALKLADKYLLKVVLCHGSAIYYTEENATSLKFMINPVQNISRYFHMKNFVSEQKLLSWVIIKRVLDMLKRMTFPYTFGVRSSYYKSQNHGGTYYLEIRKMGCSKGEGLRKLLSHIKIKMHNTAVIGDWYNDKSLFDTDALKIAVANAVPEIKKMADIITKRNNNEEGVAEFLKMLLQAKR